MDMDFEVLSDDEFHDLCRAVELAEARASKLTLTDDIEDLGLSPVNLVALRTEFVRLRTPATAQEEVLPQHAREGITLSVTDITSAQWCGLQLAYQTATGQRKKQTFNMAQGGIIHEGLELEVVSKVDILAESAEDVQAVSLLNSVACIRQLFMEGVTRELRMFGQLQGQWIVGVIDGLSLDPDTGLVSLLETKTRGKPTMPPVEQVDSARLQVMVYQLLYNSFRSLSVQDIRSYLFHHSSSGVGLSPDKPLGQALQQLCNDFADGVQQPTTTVTDTSNGTGHASSNGVHGGQAASMELDLQGQAQAASAQVAVVDLTVLSNSSQTAMTAQPTQPAWLAQPPQGASDSSHASTAMALQDASGSGHVHNHTFASGISHQHTVQGSTEPERTGSQAAQQGASGIQGQGYSNAGGVKGGGKVWTLGDCVQMLHDSLVWLRQCGDHHSLEYLWQQDPRMVIGREEVVFSEGWVRPRLDAALGLWLGRDMPRPVKEQQTWKCRLCDFKEQCRKYHPDHELSDPHTVAARALQERRDQQAAAQKALSHQQAQGAPPDASQHA